MVPGFDPSVSQPLISRKSFAWPPAGFLGSWTAHNSRSCAICGSSKIVASPAYKDARREWLRANREQRTVEGKLMHGFFFASRFLESNLTSTRTVFPFALVPQFLCFAREAGSTDGCTHTRLWAADGPAESGLDKLHWDPGASCTQIPTRAPCLGWLMGTL